MTLSVSRCRKRDLSSSVSGEQCLCIVILVGHIIGEPQKSTQYKCNHRNYIRLRGVEVCSLLSWTQIESNQRAIIANASENYQSAEWENEKKKLSVHTWTICILNTRKTKREQEHKKTRLYWLALHWFVELDFNFAARQPSHSHTVSLLKQVFLVFYEWHECISFPFYSAAPVSVAVCACVTVCQWADFQSGKQANSHSNTQNTRN